MCVWVRVCFVCRLVVICCSDFLAVCNISHILGFDVCCRNRKRNYTAKNRESDVDKMYLRDRVSVLSRC